MKEELDCFDQNRSGAVCVKVEVDVLDVLGAPTPS